MTIIVKNKTGVSVSEPIVDETSLFIDIADGKLKRKINGGSIVDIESPAPPIASTVPFTPAGNIASTDVQAAIEELDTEKSGVAHVHSVATIIADGFLSAADKTKLDSVASGATANQTDAYLLDRANHTGTQSVSTVTGLAEVATSGLASDVGLGNVDNTADIDKPISTDTQDALDLKQALIVIAPNQWFKGDSTTGEIVANQSFYSDANSDGILFQKTFNPDNLTGLSIHSHNINIDPIQDSPDQNYTVHNTNVNFDTIDSGFNFGRNGTAFTAINNYFRAMDGTGDLGAVEFIKSGFDIGDGVNAFDFSGIGYAFGFGTIRANVNITNSIQGYGFQPNVEAGASFSGGSVQAFYDGANINVPCPFYTSVSLNPNIDSIQNNSNFSGININAHVKTFTGNAGTNLLNITGIYGDVGGFDTGGLTGILLNPTVSDVGFAVGLNVDMSNVTVKVGDPAVAVIQDLTLTFIANGSDSNSYSVQYIDDVTAGSESTSLVGLNIEVHIESGVSTATQAKAAIDANISIATAIATTITGTASNAQVTDGPNSFSGGVNDGTKKAAQFTGDVEITGALTFSGALSVGQLQAFYQTNPVDGGGQPQNMHGLTTGMVGLNGVTTANVDAIGVNTAMLITLEANSINTSGPFQLGLTASALPCVVRTEAGSSIDYMSAATYAINLDATSTGGTIENLRLCRTVVIPNGVTIINNLFGFYHHQPFGSASARSFGCYIETDPSFFEYGLKIGGTPGSGDTTAHKLEVEGAALFNGNLGFFNTAPIAQPVSSGASSAGIAYTATEQAMLQEVYDAVRALGLMS